MDVFLWIATLFALGLAIVGFVIYVAWRHERKRTEDLRQAAEELGFQFSSDDGFEPGAADRFASLRLFAQGHSREARNVMRRAAQNADVRILDYTYTVGGGKNRTTHTQTVVGFESPDLDLPDFELRPENIFHRIGGLLGYQDIDFGDYPEFSRKYLLRGASEAAVRERFDAAVVDHIEKLDRVSVEGRGQQLIVYRQGKRIRPQELRAFFEEAFAVFALLKRPEAVGAQVGTENTDTSEHSVHE